MCTDKTLKMHIRKYAALKAQISELEKLAKTESVFILDEMEKRNTNELNNVSIVTDRLSENVTKAGKQALKETFPDMIETLINVSYSRFVNTRNCSKF